MSVKPKQTTLTNASYEVLNAIRNSSSTYYKNYVPIATPNADSIRKIGNVMMDNPQLQNEFINTLVNRIAFSVVVSKNFYNPLEKFKKGLVQQGENIEEIFVELAKPFQYDPEVASQTVFKRQKPDVRTAFHVLNYKKFYKTTVEQENLTSAFLSWGAMTDFISNIINSLYEGANYDEFQVMLYMIATNILSGRLHVQSIPTIEKANMEEIVSIIKSVANQFEFRSRDYNIAGVRTLSKGDEKHLIIGADFDAKNDVQVLASAFNMEKAEFIGNKVLINGFGKLDNERLAEIFEDDDNYTEITSAQLTALNMIPCMLIDRAWFMVYDNLYKLGETVNEEGLYRNYVYHTWKTLSVSPFANNTVFIPATPSVTSVAISPTTVSLSRGGMAYFTPTVVTQNFAPQTVTWSINSTKSTVSNSGMVTVASDETATSIIVTATSTFDGTKKGTATITVA